MGRHFVAGEFIEDTKILTTHAIFAEERFAVDYCKGKNGHGYIEVNSDFNYDHTDECEFILSEDLD